MPSLSCLVALGGDGCCWLECRCGSYSPLAEGWGEAYALWVKNPQFFPPREAQSSKPPKTLMNDGNDGNHQFKVLTD